LETTKLMLAAFFAALSGATPPGLVNMAVARISLEKDKRNGVFGALGASTVNLTHAFMGILLAKYILDHPSVYRTILVIGMGVFGVLAVYFFAFPKKPKPKKNELTKKDSRLSFVKGFLVSSLNILPIPYFVFVSMSFSPTTGETFSWPQILLFALSAFAGTFTMLYIYVSSFVKLEKRLKVFTQNANYFMGSLMVILFIITFIRVVHAG